MGKTCSTTAYNEKVQELMFLLTEACPISAVPDEPLQSQPQVSLFVQSTISKL